MTAVTNPERLVLDGARVDRGGFDLQVSAEFPPGQVTAVLGPNGGGKTTLLRAIAGLDSVTGGSIALGRTTWSSPKVHVPAEGRHVGYVPQTSGLFTQMNVLDNVAAGLRARGQDRASARATAAEMLERLHIGDLSRRHPTELSGGQAQRVALARALTPGPTVLLLDEPLAAIDAAARPRLRTVLREALALHDGVAIIVTHDVVDAAVLASNVLVLEHGRVQQSGPVTELAAHPRSAWVADLAGVNLWRGVAVGTEVTLSAAGPSACVVRVAEPVEGPVIVIASPNAVALHAHEPEGSPRNRWHLAVTSVEPIGTRLRVALDGALAITAEITPSAAKELDLAIGRDLWVSLKATDTRVHQDSIDEIAASVSSAAVTARK